ncbi:hypothetical protein BpHYR1_048017 [Brachionus plicatilis]|uniref:Uncharacterized protein n=1 Tax=Brachionus plicatilis TaxID=10195 RepID=A0A3M7T9V0_BRAPC|nr:hypothetical protein BpHYR1_048017 [Brachionus plicatilis]
MKIKSSILKFFYEFILEILLKIFFIPIYSKLIILKKIIYLPLYFEIKAAIWAFNYYLKSFMIGYSVNSRFTNIPYKIFRKDALEEALLEVLT